MPRYSVNLENRTYGHIEVEADDDSDVDAAVDTLLENNYDSVEEDGEDGWQISDYYEVEG